MAESCAECGAPIEPYKRCRGMCLRCYARLKYHGDHIDHERQNWTAADVLDAYAMTDSSLPVMTRCRLTAERTGKTVSSIQRAVYRARSAA